MAQYDPAFTPLKKKKEEQKEKKYDPAFTVLKPEDYELSGVEFEKPKPKEEPKQEPTIRIPGEVLFDSSKDWWDRAKGAYELFDMMAGMNSRISGAEDVEKAIARDIPKIPFVREAMKDFAEGMTFQGREAPKEGETGKRAWNEIVGGGIEGVGETLSDPRSYIMPKVFSELGRKSTWSAKDLEYWKGEYEKGRAPIQGGKATVLDPTHYPGKKTLEGSFDVEGVNALQSVTPRLPKRPSGGRFLASPSGSAAIRNVLPLAAGAQAGEFSPPVDPSDTSRFPRTLIEGTSSNILPEGPLNREPTPPPPTPLAPSKLGMEGGRGPRFGRPVGGEQMPLIPTIEGELPSTTLDEPPPIGEPQAQVPRGLIDPNRPGTEGAFTPEPRVAPRFKNKERPLKPAPPKPTVRMTSTGDIINPETGEILPNPNNNPERMSAGGRKYDPLGDRKRTIFSATNVDKAADNLNNVWTDLQYAKMQGDPGEIENLEKLLDQAKAHLDNLRLAGPTGKPEGMARKGPKANPLRPDLGPHYMGSRFSQAKSMVAANDAQNQRAIELGINPKDYPDREALAEAIYNKKQEISTEPEGMKTAGGNIAVGPKGAGNMINVISRSLYANKPEMTVTRELLQNLIDEMRISGLKGEARVALREKDVNPETGAETTSIAVRDQGRGMTPAQLFTTFTDVGESGKQTEAVASGGFGFAKAAPLLSGEYVEVSSIVKEGGKKVEYSFRGNPKQLKNQDLGVPLIRTELPKDNIQSTGMRITTHFPKQTSLYEVKRYLDNVQKHSTDIPVDIAYTKSYSVPLSGTDRFLETAGTAGTTLRPDVIGATQRIDTPQFVVEHPNVKLSFYYDPTANTDTSLFYPHYLNKGFYEKTGTYVAYGKALQNVPADIRINIEAKVNEGEDGYPFTANREQIDNVVADQIREAIKTEIVDKAVAKQAVQTQNIRDQVKKAPVFFTTKREISYYDAGSRLTREEIELIHQNPIIQALIKLGDSISEKALAAVGDQTWINRLRKVGLLFDNGNWGIHVPLDDTGAESFIGVNMLMQDPAKFTTPSQHAAHIAHTWLHELAHVEPTRRLGEDAHGTRWADRLSTIEGKLGVEANEENEISRQILAYITDISGTNYDPEFQKLLQLYKDSRGRPETIPDYLAGSSEVSYSKRGGEGIRGENNRSSTSGTRAPRYDSIPRRATPPTEPTAPVDSAIKERMFGEGHLITRAMGLSKGLVATGDLAPLLRQGGYYAGRAFWRKAAVQQFRSYASEDGHQRAIDEMKRSTLFEKNREGKTVVERMKLQLNLGKKNWRSQEESMMGIEDAEKLADFAFRGKINPVRASNRSFHDAVDTIRLGAAEGLRDNYRKFYLSLMKTAKTQDELRYAMSMNPDSDVVLQKIGEQVNQTSGYSKFGLKERRTPKDIRIPFTKKWVNVPKPLADKGILPEIDLDPVAGMFNLGLFSGRLAKSKIEQYNKVFNPYSYMKADPVMRREYLKQLLSMGASRVILTGLGAAMGGVLGTVATQSNWGKSEMGPRNPRTGRGRFSMDTTMGGGKFETLAARLYQGQYTTAKGKTSDLGSGPYIPTGLDLVEGMGEGLASPTFRAALQILDKSEHFAGPQKLGQGVGLRTVTDTMTPIIGQDLWDIIAEDPSYIPLLFPDAVGLGIQIDRSR